MSVGSFDAIQATRHWAAQGVCSDRDPDDFFVEGADQNRVKAMCRDCPVKNLCLADALDNRIEFGVWGGMTERERRRLLRQYPRVKRWLPLLEVSTGEGARKSA
ncbi:MAG: WhiB family transcriptional regulator [Dermabacter sp.]|nr:WhiB family transcriptional regulator [Dermabacter sp.]